MTVSVEAAQRVHKMISTPRGRASPKPSIKHDDGNMEEMQGSLSPVGSEKSTTGQTVSNKERRLALEQDVDELKKRLRYEEDVHRALERAFSRPLGTLPRLPSYLPAQTIELVAEVAVLEEEVMRLEEQVVIFRQDLYKEAVYISSSKSRLTASPSNLTTCPGTHKNLDPELEKPMSTPSRNHINVNHKPGKPMSTPSRNHMNVNHKPGKPKSTPPRNRLLQSLSDGKGKSDGCSSPMPEKKKVCRLMEKASEPRKLQFERRLKGLKDPAESSNSPSPASRETIPLDDNPNGNQGDIEHGNSYPSPLRKKVHSRTEKVPVTLKLQVERRLKSQENKNAAESRHSLATPEKTPVVRTPNRFMEEVGDGITCPSPMKKKVPGRMEKASRTRKVQLDLRVTSQENKDAVESRHSPASEGKISSEDSPNGISEEMECGIVCPSPMRKKVLGVTEKAPETRRLQLECRVKCQENAAESCSQASGEKTPLAYSPEKTSEETDGEISCPSPIIKKVHGTTEKASDARKLQHQRRVMKCKDNAAESIYSPASEESAPYDDNPNRVSEDILKCLSSILMRKCGLKNYRTSEQLPFLSPLLFSNRNEGMGCRDPYEICSEYGERVIGPYKDLPSIDARSVKSNRTGHYVFLEERLKVLHRKLAKIKLRNLTHQEKLAFWINIYNSCVMNGYLEYGIPENPQTVVTLMQKAKINVAGHLLNPMTIEHFILRLPYHSIYNFQKGTMNNEMTVRSMFGLELSEPLVTFALSCGSWSSPAVRVYTASQVEDELEAAKRDYLQASVGISPTKFGIPKPLDWYLLDFAKDLDSLLDWICLQLPSDLGKEAIKSLEKAKNRPLSEIVQVLPYDFSFRYLLCT